MDKLLLNKIVKSFAFTVILAFAFTSAHAQSTSWTGATSTNWNTNSNWTNGEPDENTDAIIGDASFTGSYQPRLKSGTAKCKNLTIGNGSISSELTVDRNLNVYGDLLIGSNGTVLQTKSKDITLEGDWTNNGTYTASNNGAGVTFTGSSVSLNGATTFKDLKINSGCYLTLAANITVNSDMDVYGTLNPTASYVVSGSADLDVERDGTIEVHTAYFTGNYTISQVDVNSRSYIEYASASTTQYISAAHEYGYLVISGGSTKELIADLPALQGNKTTAGYIYVNAGVLDLKTYAADRENKSGGVFVIASDAELWIGGTNTFPANYDTKTLSTTSTVIYYGNNQTVEDIDYGNLTLSGTSGSVTKTMPATTLDIYGSFSIELGDATSVSATAASDINVEQAFSIEEDCSFGASSYDHSFNGDFTNDGTFTGGTSMVTFTGTSAEISGTGTTTFNDVTFASTGIFASSGTDLSVSGDAAIVSGGTFEHQATGTFSMTGTSKSITGAGFTFYDLSIDGTITTAENITVVGDFLTDGTFTATNNAVNMTGSSALIDGTGTIDFYQLSIEGTVSTAIDFNINSDLTISAFGSFTATAGDVTFDGLSDLSGEAQMFDCSVSSGSTLNLTSNAVLKISNTLTNSGTFNTSTLIPNTVIFNKNGAQNVAAENYYNLELATGGTKTLVGNTEVYNDITINSGVTLDASTYDLSIYRHWNNNGTFTASTSDVKFVGSNASILEGTTTFYDLTVNKSSSDVELSLENNVTATNIIMTQGTIQTDVNTITTTSGRSGNGIIIGTIVHDHAIADGVTYYFEGPQNGLTFYNPSSVNEVSVTVRIGEVANVDPLTESVTRDYIVSVPSGTYDSATLRVHYEDNELNAFVEPYLALYRYNTGTTWDSLGFYSRDVSSNYVELGGFTNVNGTYMLSGLRSVVRWNGSVSSAWDNASNLTTVSGLSMANRVPDSLDVAQIGQVTFTNQPEISSTEKINVLRFGSAKAATLTFNGGSLEVVGSARGNWSTNTSHTIDVGDDSLIIGTDLKLSDGVNAHDITLEINDGVANIGNDLVQSGTGAVTFTGTGMLELQRNYEYTSGTLTAGTGTVSYEGNINQEVAPLDYYNLAIDKTTGRAKMISPLTVGNNLTTATGGEFAVLDTLTVTNDLTIGSSTEVLEFNAVIQVGGDWANNGLFSVTGGKVRFNGTGAQTVDGTTFNNLEVEKSAGALSLTDNLIINNSLKVLDGTLDVETYTANRAAEGGTFQVDSAATIQIGGADNFPRDYQTVSLDSHSNVEYDGAVAQTVLATTYGNLTFSNGSPNQKTLEGSITVLNDLTINSTAEVNPDTTTITLYGNFSNNGTVDPNQSTLLAKGSSKNITGTTTLNNLSVVGGSYTVTTGTITMEGNLFVGASSTLNFGSNTAILDGDLTNAGTLVSNGVATFTGTRVQNISLLNAISSTSTGIINFNGTVAPVINSTSSPSFATVNINNTAGITPSVPWTVVVAMNIGSGASFNGGALTHTIYGDFDNDGTFTSSGKLHFIPGVYNSGSTISLDGTAFTSTGDVEFGGTAAITLSTTSPVFDKVTISNTHSSGVTAPGSWTMNTDLEIDAGATFNAGTATSHKILGNLTNNGTLDGQSSTITFDGDTSNINGLGTTAFEDLVVGDTATLMLNSDIQVYSDFDNDGEFIASERTVEFAGTSAGTIDGTTGSVSFAELKSSKTGGATTTLNIPATVTDNLALVSGTFTTDATNILIVDHLATSDAGNDTSFVIGPMRKVGNDSFVFPLGKGSKWARLGISAPSDTTHAFTAEYFNSAYSNTTTMATSPTPVLNTVSSLEYWTCDRTTGSSNVIVSLYWESAAQSGIASITSDLVVARWNGSAWENAGHTGIFGGAQGYVLSDSVTSFSPFTFGSLSASSLPVDLLEFEAVANKNREVELSWITASEENNSHFIIERSKDGVQFEEVGRVEGAGNSTELLNYFSIDHQPYSGESFYRLKQVDLNGEYAYSDIRRVMLDEVVQVNAFPNPVRSQLTISNTQRSDMQVELIDALGKTVASTSGNSSIQLDMSDLNSGIYWLRIEMDGKVQLKRILKQ